VLIIGSGQFAKEIAQELLQRPDRGFQIVGFIDEDPKKIGQSVINPKVIGTLNQIPSIVEAYKIKKVILALPERRGKLPLISLLTCRTRGIEVMDGVSFYESVTGKILIEELRPSHLIFSKGFDRRKVTLWIKRILDLSCATVGLVLAIPFFLIIPLLIKVDSPGPVFYRQKRIGEGGKAFMPLKFRSMVTDAKSDSNPVWAKENDPRITRVGRILRKLRLDELPQLINVIKGEMSFIGPRPDIPYLRDQLQNLIPYYAVRYTIKPGVTGWAQVQSSYVSNVEEGMVRHQYDLYYIKNMSLALDLKILFKTVQIVLFGRGAR
jgi:sugar transferase (PEP-CTERM system associated)